VNVRGGVEVMTVAEAAVMLGVQRQSIHDRIRRGSIRVVARERTAGRGRLHM
jgi:hypothetical protein